ncbi:MAG: antibiotic biosynthesis monooxygenase [Candidatus Competibacteraceae bacterium]|nr:antibiotic biosynthesis monooxygenase [Candidatus Competibacteraceae bacterium]
MYVVTVHFTSHPEHSDEFMQALLKQAQNSLEREAGCIRFDVCQDPNDATRIFLYEIYTDEAVFQEHLKSAHFVRFSEETAEWVAEKSVGTWNQVFTG